ncbi:MAG TPA: sigma-70 family RNA polymerase sigma factor [Verrucomicrobiae bacterium]|nr:sigma-70 family RNA polymerase sigma factor [Verrucomicrobiae bacterium]
MGLLTSLFAANDEQLMWRVKLDDDASAFARLVQRWQKPIERLCFRMTGDAHRAEDLTQTAFARVFTRRAEWEPTGKFSTFLWRVALNLCRDDLRRQQRRGEFSLDALIEVNRAEAEQGFVAGEPTPDAQMESQERGELVRRALAELPAHYREVVVLRHYEGLKFREIGDVLGIPEGTVKSRMAEALGQLNRLLKHVNEDELCNRKTQTREVQVR